eukprot:m51a1_g3745 hypothetical protein (416) ;mRNA; r:65009-66256
MEPKARRLDAAPSEPACATMDAANLLRRFVVPHVRCPSDLASLALSFPAALAAPCLARLGPAPARRRAALLDVLFASVLRGCASPALLRSVVSARFASAWALPASAAARPHQCGAQSGRAAGETADSRCALLGLVRWVLSRAPGAECLRGEPLDSLTLGAAAGCKGAEPESEARALAVASSHGLSGVFRVLGRPPFAAPVADSAAAALVRAATLGYVSVAEAVAEAPYPTPQEREVFEALKAACKSGNFDVAAVLARPPFSAASGSSRAKAVPVLLQGAVRSGGVAALRALALPPFVITSEEAQQHVDDLVLAAAETGDAATLSALTEAPYAVGAENARRSRALYTACELGQDAIVAALAQQPFCLGQEDAKKMDQNLLCRALRKLRGRADSRALAVVKAIRDAPYSLALKGLGW